MTVQADVGDRLVIDGAGDHRECRIIRLQHPDGSPPYVVRWLTDGHLALFFPEPYTRLVRVENEDRPAMAPADSAGVAAWAGGG